MIAELFGNKNPFEHAKYRRSVEFISKFVSGEIEPQFPGNIQPPLLKVMEECMQWDYNKRPNFIQICKRLKLCNKTFGSLSNSNSNSRTKKIEIPIDALN